MSNKKHDNTNSIVLFKNDKEGNEVRPDYTGKSDVEGTIYNLSTWIQESNETGKKFLAGTVTLKHEKGSTPNEPKEGDEVLLFENDRTDTHNPPHYQGRLICEGVNYIAKVWTQKDKETGATFFAGSIIERIITEKAAL